MAECGASVPRRRASSTSGLGLVMDADDGVFVRRRVGVATPPLEAMTWVAAPRERRGLFGSTREDVGAGSGKALGGLGMRGGLFGSGAKEYTIPQRGLLGVLAPRPLAIVVFRTHALHLFPLVEQWIKAAEENERKWDGRGDPPPWPPFPPSAPALARARRAATREVVVVTTRRVLERACMYTLPRRWTWKLMKDVWESALRKQRRLLYDQTSGRWAAAMATGRTEMRASALGVLADLVVTEACCVYAYAQGTAGVPLSPGKNDFPPAVAASSADAKTRAAIERRRTRWFVRQSCANVVRSGTCLCAIGVGATAGTCVRPGLGTFIGSHVGDVAAGVCVAMVLDPWVRRS